MNAVTIHAGDHVADRGNTTNERLALRFRTTGNHCVLVLDGADWNKSEKIPENITLLLSYGPELRRISHLKQSRFANHTFKEVAEVRDACQKGWLCDFPADIASIVNRD